MNKTEISDLSHIELLVNSFYGAVRSDQLIGPVFDKVIEGRWPEHLEKMVRFWEAVLLEGHRYSGRPFPPHAALPIAKDHFDRWIQLFEGTVDRLFTGKIAEEAKWRASKMAALFMHKIDYIRNNPGKVIL